MKPSFQRIPTERVDCLRMKTRVRYSKTLLINLNFIIPEISPILASLANIKDANPRPAKAD